MCGLLGTLRDSDSSSGSSRERRTVGQCVGVGNHCKVSTVVLNLSQINFTSSGTYYIRIAKKKKKKKNSIGKCSVYFVCHTKLV